MEMEDQYGISDLRQFISRAAPPPAQFPPYPPQPPPDLYHRGLTSPPQTHYDMVVMGRHVNSPTHDMLHQATARGAGTSALHHHHHQDHFNSDSTTTTATAMNNSGGCGFDGGDGGSVRWPRQETLTLLEIRSRLDHKFKEANQKGPLWDEVARLMLEEHGYQRSGKKCREKFENLYKYYKKTKEGKAGRQDGKHYRFFRQLEALYGEQSSSTHQTSTSEAYIVGNTPHFHNNPISEPNNNNIISSSIHHHQEPQPSIRGGCDRDHTSASLSNSSDYATSSSEEDGGDLDASMESNGSKEKEKKKRPRGSKRSWKAKIKDFIDVQMRRIMEKQEAWLEKMMKTIEKREQERVEREEEWRKHEVERVEREHKFWARERAWIEARDSALMKALEKLSNDNGDGNDRWAEPEVTRLIQLRTNMEARFQQCGFSEEVLWEDIAAKMAYFGYERSAIVCKEKWDSINKSLQEKGNNHRKIRKEKNNYGMVMVNSNSHNHQGGLYMNNPASGFHNYNGNSNNNNNNHGEINEPRIQLNEGSSSPTSHNTNINVNAGNMMNDSCLRFFLGDAENLGWETNYGVKAQQG